ncbi:hypothetical protein ERJ75_001731100 [Trypanosoma vivax]|nr:hypothetical protein TRVL_03091 [Trypanosoma vivax]KAH8604174.1 hypothetical protein ERJ75_001731100 [Trypanosoma vivax]
MVVSAGALGGGRQNEKSYSAISTTGTTWRPTVEPVTVSALDEAQNDSFGLPSYVPRCSSTVPCGNDEPRFPCEEKSKRRQHAKFPQFLYNMQFWRQLEFAARVTLLAVLPTACLVAKYIPLPILTSKTYALSAVVLSSRFRVGEMIEHMFTWLRAGLIWLPLATAAVYVRIGDNFTLWCVFYAVLLFLFAASTGGMARRIFLLLFNICMIGLLSEQDRPLTYPSEVMMNWCVGIVFCVIAVFIPCPRFNTACAESNLGSALRQTGTTFSLMSTCFWSSSNVERNMGMTKARMSLNSIDSQLEEFSVHQKFSFLELLFKSSESYETRTRKAKLTESLRIDLSSLFRVLDIAEMKSWIIDDSELCKKFGLRLNPSVQKVASLLELLMEELAVAHTFESIKNMNKLMEDLREAKESLQREFNIAREELFYKHKLVVLEEFIPLMVFFIFSVVSCTDTILQFKHSASDWKYSRMDNATAVLRKNITEPIWESLLFFVRVVKERQRRDCQRLIEAVKVSLAMLIAVIVTISMGVERERLSGPNVIAFVSGSNPVEAMQASLVRLTACILGTVLGFLAGTYSAEIVTKIVSLCALFFIGTFFRLDKQYSIMAVYALFVLIPLNTIELSKPSRGASNMNEITTSILIYVFISVVVLPLNPSCILRKKRINILLIMDTTLKNICSLFTSRPGDVSLLGEKGRVCESRLVGANGVGMSTSNHPKNRAQSTCIGSSDAVMNSIYDCLADLSNRLSQTRQFMSYAKDERGLIAVNYPVKACEQINFHLHRMVCLLRTMCESWSALRREREYSSESLHVFRSLQPIALDASHFFSCFVRDLCNALRNPAAALQTELTKTVLDFTRSVEELHLRKNHIMIAVINMAVDSHRVSSSEPAAANDVQNLANTASLGASENKDAVLAFLRKKAMGNLNELHPSVAQEVDLSGSFAMPVSGEDVWGLHTFSVCFQMFANEAKMLLVSVEEMLEHDRRSW